MSFSTPSTASLSLLEGALADGAAVNYINAAIFTVLAWDVLICLAEELSVAVTCGLCPSIVAYYMSRVGILSLSLLQVVMLSAPIAHCEAFWHTAVAAGIIGSVATSFLFLLQVRAVYDKSKSITIFFGIFWLAIPVVTSLVNITGQSTHGAGSNRCNGVSGLESYPSIVLWVKVAYDTSIFVAITLRIFSYSTTKHIPNPPRLQCFRGVGLPQIFRDLLQGGQLYYFVTVGVNLMGACALTVSLPLDPAIRIGLTQPAAAIESIMACRVFRMIVRGSGMRKEHRVGTDSIVLTTVQPYSRNDELERR